MYALIVFLLAIDSTNISVVIDHTTELDGSLLSFITCIAITDFLKKTNKFLKNKMRGIYLPFGINLGCNNYNIMGKGIGNPKSWCKMVSDD